MTWIYIALFAVIGFLLYRLLIRTRLEARALSLRKSGVFSRSEWSQIPFQAASMPMRMAFNEVATKNVYQINFKAMFSRFIAFALKVDEKLNAEEVQNFIETLYDDLSNIKFLSDEHTQNREYGMVQAATLYALICTQDKGMNIKRKLMEVKNNQLENNMFTQSKTDREYFTYMNDNFPNFCRLTGLLEPRKSSTIEIVAGYLILDK